MAEVNVVSLLSLLEKANNLGVKISPSDDELVVTTSKGKAVDKCLLDELKANKENLLEYFRRYQTPARIIGVPGSDTLRPLEYDGKKYWKVIPSLVYWLDERDKEFKEGIQCRLMRRISGKFDVGVLRMVISYLIRRHESLRASFRKIGEDYYTATEDADSPMYDVDFKDIRDAGSGKDSASEKAFIYFDGHKFDLQNGPLFLVRVMQTGDEEYILAIKVHHVIYDGWSLDVLLRDLSTAYMSYASGEPPALPELKFQFKDYMFFRNSLIQKGYDRQQQYWRSLYNGLPGELTIPGAKMSLDDQVRRNGETVFFSMSADLLKRLNALSGKFGTSLFIVLQAAFKHYLSRVTGQSDIVIGTMCFGRDELDGIEDQIGYYLYTDLIRTILDKDDSFEEVVERVKKSNQDMKENTLCTLITFLSEMLPPGQAINATAFWKVNLNYTDISGLYLDESVMRDLPPEGLELTNVEGMEMNNDTDLDIKIEFVNFRHKMEITILYDCNRYDGQTIATLINGYLKYMGENLCPEHNNSFFYE
jgi:hypothetical protein